LDAGKVATVVMVGRGVAVPCLTSSADLIDK
jgi:hypothetical protein